MKTIEQTMLKSQEGNLTSHKMYFKNQFSNSNLSAQQSGTSAFLSYYNLILQNLRIQAKISEVTEKYVAIDLYWELFNQKETFY